MENKDLAHIFSEMADILEIQDSNPFRIRSFRRVAQIIEDLSFSVAHSVRDNPQELQEIPGIGAGAIRRIQEIVQTRHSQEHEDLLNQVPPPLLVLLDLQNLGPKKISLFWKSLNITTIDELEKAAREQRLRHLPGMGEKSEAKILKSIEEYRSFQGRFRLDDGMEVADNLIEYLKSKTELRRIAVAGSVRRRCETVGDIDILVTCKSPETVIEAFTEYPEVIQVLAKGDTKASVTLRQDLQSDLRVLDDDSFGSALQYFTGSQAHNVVLRERAKRMGFKISEYGLFQVDKTGKSKKEKRVAGKNEEEIYRHLNLSYIPPEIRENRGEIEGAEKKDLPDLITTEDIRGDLHMHTTATDGRNSIDEMAAAGLLANYEYIAITDHSQALAMAGGLNEEKLLLQIEEIDRVALKTEGISILKGIEVDILTEGNLDLNNEVLSRLDIVIVSIHSRFNMSGKEMTLRICHALENPYVNILAHPTGRLITRREAYSLDLEKIFKTAKENRVCLEINAHPSRLDLNDLHCRMARDMGALISINSDSHSTEMLGNMQYGVFTARRGWLQTEDVINTYTLDNLRKVLKKETYGLAEK